MSGISPQNDPDGPPRVSPQGAKGDPDVPRNFGQGQGVQDVRLIHQPTGWTAMANNMKEFDEEKFANVKDDIDSLLVFAGLFSAVLTAFVVESYKRLSPDTTSAILATSSQSLAVMQQISLQMSNSSVQPLNISTNTSTPPFHPSLDDIHINALWFSSLIFSLITASFAILVKQWLREYTVFKITSPQARLRVRHYRYRALQRWHVFGIAAALPLFQQISLGLFFAGLCIFTISIHKTVSITSITLVAAWAFLFVATTFLPIFIPRCPYKTTLLKPIVTAIHFSTVQALARPMLWCCETGSPALVKLALWWHQGSSRAAPTPKPGGYRGWLREFLNAYKIKNDEEQIAQQDTADLEILSEADALRSNDDLLGTTIFESLKQIHKPPWNGIVNFVFQLLDHRLPPTERSHVDTPKQTRHLQTSILEDRHLTSRPDSSSPRHTSLQTLSWSAYEGMIDILCHFLQPHLVPVEESESMDANLPLTKCALLLFFSKSRYPFPASGIRLLLRKPRIPISMLEYCLQTEERIKSLLQVITQIIKLDPEHGFLFREDIWDVLASDCLRSSHPVLSLDRLLRVFDLHSCNDRHLRNLMSSLARHCLHLARQFISFDRPIAEIAALEEADAGRLPFQEIIIAFTDSCLQSEDPSASILSLMVAIDGSPHFRGRLETLVPLTHGCLQAIKPGPVISLGYLMEAIYTKAYRMSDRYALVVTLTQICLQATEPGLVIPLRHLMEAIDNGLRAYTGRGSDHYATVVAIIQGCSEWKDPSVSLSSFIQAINHMYTVHDDGTPTHDVQTSRPVPSHIHDVSLEMQHIPEHLQDTTAISFSEGMKKAFAPGHHLGLVDSTMLLAYILKAINRGTISKSSLVYRHCLILSYLQTLRRVFLRHGNISWVGRCVLSPTLEESLQVFGLVIDLIFKQSGTQSGSQEFTLCADFAAFQWKEDVWPTPIADEAMEYIANIITRSTHEETDIWAKTTMPTNSWLKAVLICMWYLAPLGTRARALSTFDRSIADCLSHEKYTIQVALLEALDRVPCEVVANVCSNAISPNSSGPGLCMLSKLTHLIRSFSMIFRLDASISESDQVTSTSDHQQHPLSVSHALKITCLVLHFAVPWNVLEQVDQWTKLLEAIIQLVYQSIGIALLSENPGQVGDSTIVVQLTRAIRRPYNLRELDMFAVLARCCVGRMRWVVERTRGAISVDTICNKQFMEMLGTIYVASSPTNKDLSEDLKFLRLPGLVEEVRSAMTVVEGVEQFSSATAGPNAWGDVENNSRDPHPEPTHGGVIGNLIVVPTAETSDVAKGSSQLPPNLDLEEFRPTSPSASMATEAQESTTAPVSTG